MITYRPDLRLFSIRTPGMSYGFRVEESGCLCGCHFGAPLLREEDMASLHRPEDNVHLSLSTARTSRRKYREEYPAGGGFYYGEPALRIVFPDGVRDVELRYVSHRLSEDGLSLTVTMRDPLEPVEVDLCYKTYPGLDLISRRSIIRNTGDRPFVIESALSAVWYGEDHAEYRLSYMTSGWAREYELHRVPLEGQRVILESRSCLPNSNYYPYFALDRGDATERSGEVWYGTLHWSGNFKIAVDRHDYGAVSVAGGINDYDFSWKLEGHESFDTPWFTAGYSARGFGAASRTLHDLERGVLMPAEFRAKPIPMLYNSWCAFEFDVHEEQVEPLAALAEEMGVELFVIDDGWFGSRDSDRAGLGDWFPSPKKFPHGIDPVIEAVHRHNMLFGIWVEPEMVNEDSELYRSHPDWVFSFPGRERETMRHQLMLNLGRDDVRDFVIDMLDRLLGEHKIDYLKWDMNRSISQPGDRTETVGGERGFWVRYVRNLHAIFSHLREHFPHLLIENCAAGGMRNDISMTQYCVRTNRSDNQDPRDELFLQEGFTQVMCPALAGGAGHLGRQPYGINGRSAPLPFRGLIGCMGSLGMSIDLRSMTPEQRAAYKQYIDIYKEIRMTVQKGDLYRLLSAREGDVAAFLYVAKDGADAVLFLFGLNLDFRRQFPRLRLDGLQEEALYEVEGRGIMRGDLLMRVGIRYDLRGDYDSELVRIRRISE